MIKFKRILFPTDFSSAAAHALDFAISLALQHEAVILLVHVIEDIGFTMPDRLSSFPSELEFDHRTEDTVKLKLEKAVCSQLKRQIKVEEIVLKGRPFLEIIRLAHEREADLIIIPTHSHDGVKHAHFGSTSERVARRAPCPVLVIRHPDFQFSMP